VRRSYQTKGSGLGKGEAPDNAARSFKFHRAEILNGS
jgi:hypothetical protein